MLVSDMSRIIPLCVFVLFPSNDQNISQLGKKASNIDAMGFGLVNKCNKDDDYARRRNFQTMGDVVNPSPFKGIPTFTAWVGGNEDMDAKKQTHDEILNGVKPFDRRTGLSFHGGVRRGMCRERTLFVSRAWMGLLR